MVACSHRRSRPWRLVLEPAPQAQVPVRVRVRVQAPEEGEEVAVEGELLLHASSFQNSMRLHLRVPSRVGLCACTVNIDYRYICT
jgi:hypothetical protein